MTDVRECPDHGHGHSGNGPNGTLNGNGPDGRGNGTDGEPDMGTGDGPNGTRPGSHNGSYRLVTVNCSSITGGAGLT